MQILLDTSTILGNEALLTSSLSLIREDATFLRDSYPEFDKWLTSTVLPGIPTGERTIIIERRDDITAGVLILKHTATEKKLCTLRVRPAFESKGLGVRLFETAFQVLGTERPLLSVSQPLEPKFHRLFTYFGFAKEAVYQGRYLPMVDELAYNGLLEEVTPHQDRIRSARLPNVRAARAHKGTCLGPVCLYAA